MGTAEQRPVSQSLPADPGTKSEHRRYLGTVEKQLGLVVSTTGVPVPVTAITAPVLRAQSAEQRIPALALTVWVRLQYVRQADSVEDHGTVRTRPRGEAGSGGHARAAVVGVDRVCAQTRARAG